MRVVNKTLAGGKYHKLKGMVTSVVDKYGAEVSVYGTGDTVVLDQDDLETVVPAVGGAVLVLNGEGRGEEATLLEIREEEFVADLKLVETGEVVRGVEYEDFTKKDPGR